MFLNFAIVAIMVCITSQDVQGNDCAFSDDDVKVEKRKCQKSLQAGFTLCCNFSGAVIDNSKCENIPENQLLYVSIIVGIQRSDLPCLMKAGKNQGLGDAAIEQLIRQTLADNNLTLASFKAVHMDYLYPNREKMTGGQLGRLIFSEVINTNITEEVALAVLAIEKKRRVTILGFNITVTEHIGIFTKRPTESSLDEGVVDWCSSSRLHVCPLNSHCKNTGIRYTCICDNNLVKIGNKCTVPVQLVSSNVPHQGRVEYYTNGIWQSLCSDMFRALEARVVCRQLGFDGREAIIYTDANVTGDPSAYKCTNGVSIYNFRCSGKETSLMDCTKETRSSVCSEADLVYVKCNTECPDDNHYGPNCTQTCDCLKNNTEFCNRQNGSCVCSDGWEGEKCTDDVDECALGRHYCIDFNEQCENIPGSFRCVCKPKTMEHRGYCVGNILSDPLPFKTDGSQDMTLSCNPPNNTSVLEWNVLCSKTSNNTCTFKPQPYDDGRPIICYTYQEDYFGEFSIIFIAKIILDLQYPPSQPPEIKGYGNGQVVKAGESLRMNCIVEGGKPQVRAVNFSCPGHTDAKSMSNIISVLQFDPVRAEDDGITCTCSAEWEDPTFYNLTATRVLTVNFPPSNPPEIDGYENGQVVNAGEYLPMTCTVKGGKPQVRAVNFSCPGHTDAKSMSNIISVLQFDPVRAEDDGKTCTCSAEWEDPTFYDLTSTRVLKVNVPPSNPPEIDGYENGQVVNAGKYLRMSCTVKGGKPLVRAVNFSCPGHPDLSDDESVNNKKSDLMFLPVRVEDDGITCTCSAEWEDPTLYNLTATRVLTVNGTNYLPYLNIPEALGVGTAAIVCVVIIVFGVWKYKRRRTYGNLIRKYIGRYSVFAHFSHGDDTTEDYAEIDDDLVNVEDSDRTDQGYSRPLPDPLPRACTSMATIPLSVENELTTVAIVQEDESDTGYFYGTYSVSATEDSGKIETPTSQDSNDDKLEATRETSIQDCFSMSDSDRLSRKDYLQPSRTMSLSDEIPFPECNYSQSLEVHEGGEKKDYLYPTSDMSLPDEVISPECTYSQSLEVHEGGEKNDYFYPGNDMSLPDEIPFPKCKYSQSLEVHEGDKKNYLHPTSDMSLPDEVTSLECSPAENINKKN